MAGTERNMPEGGSSPDIGTTAAKVTPVVGKDQTPITPVVGKLPESAKRPWVLKSEYDPTRKDYVTREVAEDTVVYDVLYDPLTGKEVARVAKVTGGRGLLWRRGQDQPGDQRPSKPTNESNTPKEPVNSENANMPQYFPGYDPARVGEYEIREEGGNLIAIDPRTRQVVAIRPQNVAEQNRIEDPNDQSQQTPTTPDTTRGNAGGGSRGGPEGPRGPRPPDMTDAEWEMSPERGRYLVDEIVRLRTTMSYTERYNSENGPYLRQLYSDLQKYIDKLCETRHEKDPWDPQKAYRAIQEAQASNPDMVEPPEGQRGQELPPREQPSSSAHRVARSEQAEPRSAEDEVFLTSLTIEQHQQRIVQLAEAYDNEDNPNVLAEIQRQLLIYFREAKRQGLLEDADNILTSFYEEQIRPGTLSANQIARETAQTLALASRSITDVYKPLRSNPEAARLKGVWNAYEIWARERLQIASRGREAPEYLKQLLSLEQDSTEESRETYWEPSSWTGYYIIKAKTPEQFRIAAKTFLRMMRTGSIGKSPEELYKHFQNFKETFGAVGSKEVEAQKGLHIKEEDRVTAEFMKNLRLEFEAQAYIFGADYSNETYNAKSYKEFMMAMAMHEGPDRWVRLIRSGGGQVAAFTHIFDNDAIMDMFNNPTGERGELDIIAGHFLQDQIREMVIERGMGIRLKDYDPEDISPDSLIRSSNVAEADLERTKYFNANLERIGIPMSNEALRALYEGFNNNGDGHLNNYLRFKEVIETGRLGLNQFPASLRKSVELGRIQEKVKDLDRKTIDKLKKGQKIDTAKLSEKEQRIWKDAYDQADANFDIAFQMQGATGEKARRGRGFLYVDRNSNIRAYYEAEERSERIKWILNKLSQIRKEVPKGMDISEEEALRTLDEKTKEFFANLSPEEKNLNQGLYGINKNRLSKDQQRSIRIGQILSQLRDGKRIDAFSDEDQKFYRELSDEDKSDFIDNLPTYQAENFVLLASNLAKIKYANVSAEVRRAKVEEAIARAINEIHKNGFEAKIWDDELGSDGQPRLMTVKRPLGKVDPNTGKFTKFKNGEIIGYNDNGQAITLSFDQEGKPIGLDFDQEGKPVIFDKKEIEGRKRVVYDNLTINTRARLNNDIFVEEVAATFQYAQSGDFRTRYTTHTYWAYQGNNRHTLLAKHIFAAAMRIREGESCPEDEDPLATQLLIVDPTLRRVKRFNKDQQQREITLVNAAVEEGYQDRQDIMRAIHKKFIPPSGFRNRMRAGYDNEDWAGQMRYTLGFQELVASQPARFARRLMGEVANAPIEIDSMAAIWGRHGVLGAMGGFADQIKRYSHQGVVGQFGITKFINQMALSFDIYDALVGHVDGQTNQHVEGLMMKPTNNNEQLHQYYGKEDAILYEPQAQTPFLYDFLKTFGRLERVLKLMRNMYSDVRNAGGALDLRGVEIFLAEDGTFNSDIERLSKIANDTGTSRHSEKIFFDAFVKWLISEKPGGGADMYPEEVKWNRLLLAKRKIDVKNPKFDPSRQINAQNIPYLVIDSKDTFADWVFSKIGL